jgi:hypothetical protein
MVDAGGVGILSLIDKTQLIDFLRRQKNPRRWDSYAEELYQNPVLAFLVSGKARPVSAI